MKTIKITIGTVALLTVAGIALFTAIAHLSCIVLGAECFRAQLAPKVIVDSAIEGTWIAPIGTVFISTLFLLCAVYALSAAKIVKPMPMLKLAIFTISGLCLLRGAATVPLALHFTDTLTPFILIAGFIWFLSGVLLLLGYFLVNRQGRTQ